MKTEDCFKKRLLRKTKPDLLKMQKALEMAEIKRERAEELFRNDFFEESIVASYTSMFQAARAILFKDGIIEKSHACEVAYLKDSYNDILGQDRINWLDTYRLERHESFYGLDKSLMDREEAEDALEKSEKFFFSAKLIIQNFIKK